MESPKFARFWYHHWVMFGSGIWNSDNIDDSSDTATRVVVLSEQEWKQLYYNKLWLGENDLTAVTVT